MVNVQKLIKQGAHFGSFSINGHPQTRKFLYGNSNSRKTQVIDLVQTGLSLERAKNLIKQVSVSHGSILIVATQEPMDKIILRLAQYYPIHYVHNKWLGGMLTNWKTLSEAVKKLHALELLEKKGHLNKLSSQDILKLNKQKARLEKYLGGIKYLNGLPWLVILMGAENHQSIIAECDKLNIPTIGVLDTECSPTDLTVYVPCSAEAPQSHFWIVFQIITTILTNPRISLRKKPILNPSLQEASIENIAAKSIQTNSQDDLSLLSRQKPIRHKSR
jgi:small subunit ribosomal protein S2